jgi:hypothetical protein
LHTSSGLMFLQNIFMKKILPVFIFSTILLFFSACTKNYDNYNYAPTPTGNLLISNLCADALPLDVYINGTIGVSALPYSYYSPYSPVSTGTTNMILAVENSSTSVLNVNLNVVADSNYSFFIIDSFHAITAATTQDILKVPSGDSAKIRILDFAPNAGSLDVALPGGGAVVSGARTFNDQTLNTAYQSFITVPAGTYSYDVRQAGSQNVLVSSTSYAPFVFAQGKIYTMVLTGFVGSTGVQALALTTINNN